MVVVGNLHRGVMEEPGMLDDEFNQAGGQELNVAKGCNILWCWPVDIRPTGIVGNPFKRNGAGGEHDEGQWLGRTWRTSVGQTCCVFVVSWVLRAQFVCWNKWEVKLFSLLQKCDAMYIQYQNKKCMIPN